jgi:hypothetical protein
MPTHPPARLLVELREVAATRRAARWHIADLTADLTAEHGPRSLNHAAAWEAHRAITDRWSQLFRDAVGAGHTKADVARAAGAAPSLYRLLRG